MQIYLGLGSNVGDRRENIQRAIALLDEYGLRRSRVSPLFETPALLPKSAPADWNRPYLNLALEGEVDGSPLQWRGHIKKIEARLGREAVPGWQPRTIDIDILLWGTQTITGDGLHIPQANLQERDFVLTPLLCLRPDLRIPGLGSKTLLEWSHTLTRPLPLWMGILNITPDSFSDGGCYTHWQTIEPHLDEMVAAGAQIIDIGAESTRPKATELTPAEEWSRLEPVLKHLAAKYRHDQLRPRISIDTRHPETAEKALAQDVDIINDVGGLQTPAMLALARDGSAEWIAMHSLTVPANPTLTLPKDCDPCAEVENWLLQKLAAWDKNGLDLNKIIFDPGIGFGKTSLQSLEILRRAGEFRKHGLRVLIGHSRKSFMKDFVDMTTTTRDLVTIGASLQLCQQGVDIIRVHDIASHTAAYRGWAHLQTQPNVSAKQN